MHDFNTTCLTMARISETTADLYKIQKHFNDKVTTHKWLPMEEVYSVLNHTIVAWEKSIRKQIDTIQNHLNMTFNYTTKEFEAFNEVQKF